MRALGLAWVGIFPDRFVEMVEFLQDVVGLSYGDADDEVTMLHTARGDSVEVFRPHARYDFATTGPIPGFLVEDATAAARELAAAGAELLGEGGQWEGNRWQHFRAPDGFVYEVTSGAYDPAAPGTGLVWAGTRSAGAVEMAQFAEGLLGMDVVGAEHGIVHLHMPNGHQFEVIRHDEPDHAFMDAGPMIGFSVVDFPESLRRLDAWGAQLHRVLDVDQIPRGVLFRGPDGRIYDLIDFQFQFHRDA